MHVSRVGWLFDAAVTITVLVAHVAATKDPCFAFVSLGSPGSPVTTTFVRACVFSWLRGPRLS